jgi:hypothetical protein
MTIAAQKIAKLFISISPRAAPDSGGIDPPPARLYRDAGVKHK